MTEFDLAGWSQVQLQRIEQHLAQWVGAGAPQDLRQAMQYAVLDGGKRLRPLLVLASSEAVGGNEAAALRAACAVELVHAYSLVHDDMPCMDNDVLRRGKPTTHVQFGQGLALLAGDALQAQAFELLTPEDPRMPLAMQALLCRQLAAASGATGMAGGQAIDLASVGHRLTEPQLREMHRLKTGALLKASVTMGATCGQAGETALQALQAFGSAIGLAFQVVDDILDVTADSKTLGKTAGKDAEQEKPTYVSLLGLPSSRLLAQSLGEQALAALRSSGLAQTHALQALALRVIDRAH